MYVPLTSSSPPLPLPSTYSETNTRSNTLLHNASFNPHSNGYEVGTSVAGGETEALRNTVSHPREFSHWAADLSCDHPVHPCLCLSRHWACRGHWYSENKRKNAVSTDLCCGSPSKPGLCRHFEGLSLPFWLRTLPGVPIALSPSRCFNYLKLFLSKDRKVNSLSTPHLTYKREIELLFFK